MAQDKTALIWLDMEMTGLDPRRNRIIELAMVITNSELEVIAQAPVWAVRQSKRVLDGMDSWNQKHHARSGLVERVLASRLSVGEVEAEALEFVRHYVPSGKSPMCGNTICQDRRFMAQHMPRLEAWFHYRNLDVSTLKELCRRWSPQLAKGFRKHGRHEALADILESIEELRYYRSNFIKASA